MVTDTGKNLDVLIVSRVSTDWETFATWYSVLKNLPEANVTISCMRTGETPFQFFQWAKRLNIQLIRHNRFSDNEAANTLHTLRVMQEGEFVSENVLLLKPLMMVVDTLNEHQLKVLSEGISIETVTEKLNDFLKEEKELADIHPIFNLWKEAKTTEVVWPIISYRKGCGRWIDTAKGCPFSSAGGLVSGEMTVNELRVNDLWRKMTNLYSAVS